MPARFFSFQTRLYRLVFEPVFEPSKLSLLSDPCENMVF